MEITFDEARDLGRFGTVAAGETRADLPDDFARLQVQYGVAHEAPVTKKEKTAQEE